jgi:hypothetical protein
VYLNILLFISCSFVESVEIKEFFNFVSSILDSLFLFFNAGTKLDVI